MRLFVAIAMTGEVAAELGALLGRWQETDWPVKWVRPEGLHLTLKFLGEVGEEQYSRLVDIVAAAVQGTPPLTLTLTEVGAFPTVPRARVLWAGLENDTALELLVHRVEQGAGTLGFPIEGRPYRPHVTLGRIREGQRLGSGAVQSIERAELAPASCLGSAVHLYQSHTGGGGSRYEVRATFPLESIA